MSRDLDLGPTVCSERASLLMRPTEGQCQCHRSAIRCQWQSAELSAISATPLFREGGRHSVDGTTPSQFDVATASHFCTALHTTDHELTELP